jgi:hypothetical protein
MEHHIMTKTNSLRLRIGAGAFSAILIAAAAPGFAANTIPLSGTAGAVCSISTTVDPGAANLPITTPGPQTVTVGTVLQSCNITAGYTLTVTSANCAPAPAGAKLVQGSNNLPFSVNATNPTTGGSTASVTGLLSGTCTGQITRDVTGAAVTSETSTIAAAFTGSATLFPGTYQDTLTFTMTTK